MPARMQLRKRLRQVAIESDSEWQASIAGDVGGELSDDTESDE